MAREAAASWASQTAGGFAVSCCFLGKQRLWAIGAGGVRRRWVQQAGEEGELGVGRAGPRCSGAAPWRMARWTQEGGVGAGAEAAHGTGGGKWFPGIPALGVDYTSPS